MQKNKIFIIVVFLIVLPLFSFDVNIRLSDHDGFTRIVFESENSFEFKYRLENDSILFSLPQKIDQLKGINQIPNSLIVDRVIQQNDLHSSTLVVKFKQKSFIRKHFVLERPFRVVFDLEKASMPIEKKLENADPQETVIPKIPEENTSYKNVLIERICLDPGHGGSDYGAVGSQLKILEKNITLKVCEKLKKMIEGKLGLKVILTRQSDAEVSLNGRVSIANNQKAQLFISIHVNASFRQGATGPETFYVSLNATDQESFELAQNENKSFTEIEEAAEDNDLKMILWNMAQTEYIKESSHLAEFIQNELNILFNTVNRGVKQAPFRVLMRAAMPAVLIEAGFLSNPAEQRKFASESFMDQLTEAIYRGMTKYIYIFNSRIKN